MGHKFFLVFLLCVITLPLASLAAEPESEPVVSDPEVQVVENLNLVFLQCLQQGEELSYSERYALLEPVMRESFFYELIIRKSTGDHWKTFSNEQQKALLEKYIIWSVGRYARRFKKYRGQKFEIVSSEPVSGKYRRVTCLVTAPGKESQELKYLLTNYRDQWLIVDIQVDGVSQLAQTRARFTAVLDEQGIDVLLKGLDKKTRKLKPVGRK